MATPRVSENPVTQQHYAAQLALSAELASAIKGLGQNSTDVEMVAGLTHEFSFGAITLASDYYTDVRDLAGVTTAYRTVVTSPWDSESIAAYIDASVTDVAPDAFAPEIEALAQKIALDAGTDDLFANIANDREARRWARVARPGACAFCLMLAARGAVYRTESSGNFRAHPKCHCDVEPLFGNAYEPPAHIRAMQSLWSESTGDVTGSKAKQNAFRRAVYADRNTSR